MNIHALHKRSGTAVTTSDGPATTETETTEAATTTSTSSADATDSGANSDAATITECGVSVTTISDWAVGECGTRTTQDPRVFGPEAWLTFHRFAQNYPETPNNATYNACKNFINAIPYMVPCPHCGYDFQLFIEASIEHEGTYSSACAASKEYDMPCQGPKVWDGGEEQ